MSVQQIVSIMPDGFDDLADRLAAMDDEAFEIISTRFRAAALTLHGQIVARSPVDSGRYRGSWGHLPSFSEDEYVLEAKMANNMEYAEPVTYGSEVGHRPWPNAGPRTVRQGNRIYSSQAPGGVIDPLLEDWGNDLMNEIREELVRGLGGV